MAELGCEPRYPDAEAMQLTTNYTASHGVKHGSGEGWSWIQIPALLLGLGLNLSEPLLREAS